MTKSKKKIDDKLLNLAISGALETLKTKIISGEIKDASTCNAVGLAILKGFI